MQCYWTYHKDAHDKLFEELISYELTTKNTGNLFLRLYNIR